jgi:hypothetical protein
MYLQEGLRNKLSESVSEAIKEMLKANSLDPEAVVVTALLQKLMNSLGLTPGKYLHFNSIRYNHLILQFEAYII